jgi:hypothetical protein
LAIEWQNDKQASFGWAEMREEIDYEILITSQSG